MNQLASYTAPDVGLGPQTTSCSYDLDRALTSITDYVVDAAQQRVLKKVNGVVERGWLYRDRLRPVAELDAMGGVVSRFVYTSRPNVPDYMVRGGTRYRLVHELCVQAGLCSASHGLCVKRANPPPTKRDTTEAGGPP